MSYGVRHTLVRHPKQLENCLAYVALIEKTVFKLLEIQSFVQILPYVVIVDNQTPPTHTYLVFNLRMYKKGFCALLGLSKTEKFSNICDF